MTYISSSINHFENHIIDLENSKARETTLKQDTRLCKQIFRPRLEYVYLNVKVIFKS
uniref:Uncharacterized protein n=1 Tax=Anguilla anguilla TaxID=7936 RepID=A0A0E9Q3Y8_ANGAN